MPKAHNDGMGVDVLQQQAGKKVSGRHVAGGLPREYGNAYVGAWRLSTVPWCEEMVWLDGMDGCS